MSRRASYMYGNLLPTNPLGQVGAGLGQTTSSGLITLIQPTEYITATGQTLTIDGIDILFQLTPDTEAPAEMNFVFPQYQALCMAENATHNMHNLYTLRGAAVRDAKGWAQYIDDAITLFAGHYNVVFATHHWPIWGVEAGEDFLKKQRDMYKYLHDQTLRLANQGHTMHEIPDLIEFPPELGRAWFNRGYYGTVSHNVKAVYNRYLGFFDGNPATLNPLSPTEGGKKYVEFMGGAAALLEKARQSFEAGEYRWVAEVVNHLVFADPENEAARALQADALEQLGYQAESGPWRNFYLSAAKELRDGVLDLATPKAASPDTVRATPIAMFFDLLAVRLNGMKAAGKVLRFNFNLTDTNEQYTLVVENGVLNYRKDQQYADADASLITTRSALDRILMGQATAAEKLATGQAVIEGDRDKLIEFMGLLDNFEFWFNIVTP
jgi:alkyl sulfatase BDS1-like metallo-beta-lactamase superfamily hydrolase